MLGLAGIGSEMDRTDVSQIGWGTYEESLFGNGLEVLYVCCFSQSHRKWSKVGKNGERERLVNVSMTEIVGVGTSTYSPIGIRNTDR
jgi:hypothetical protein